MDISLCRALIVLLALSAGRDCAGESLSVQAGQDPYQQDLYYDAMLRSIELDRSRWKSFSRSMEGGPWFYNTQGLKRNGSRVTAQVTVYPHPGRTELYRSVHQDHTKIRKIDFVTEIDCPGRTYRQSQINVYGYYKDLLAGYSSAGSTRGFSPIKPGTTIDTLRGLVCGPDRKKRR